MKRLFLMVCRNGYTNRCELGAFRVEALARPRDRKEAPAAR
jgi:hypothetical protein